MSNSKRSRKSGLTDGWVIFLLLAIAVYLLRGFGILSFLPGGILLALLGITLFIAILAGVEKTRRF